MRPHILLVLLITLTNSSIPPNFKKCFRKDPNFKNCILEAVQSGIPQLTKPFKSLDLPNLEPFEVPLLTVRDKGGAVALNQNFKNCVFYGLTTMKIQDFDLDFGKKTLFVDSVVPKMVFKCHYQLEGKVLVLPIKGDGNSTIKFTNFRLKFRSFYDEIVRNSKTYYTTASTEMQSDVEHSHFQFDNLFNGNKELGDNVNLVLNDNWRQVVDELHPEYNEIVRQILTGMIEKVWTKVSLEEMFD
ncbi:hypothetical protein Zmor_016977 [Zophobas morio]|uniref:Uncharacterized protein n=1 Tax=Zophobas morio TaxID=2755281 RepID=A0AA38MCB4_9CUCU|nr:hypothetical protein Zmor_016977 [Zophobas morio]